MPTDTSYLFLNNLFANLQTALVRELVTPFSPAILESVSFFSGNPVQAIQMHLEDIREGSRTMMLLGYSPETPITVDAAGQAVTSIVPVSILIIRSFSGRGGSLADFQALNSVHDFTQRAMHHHIITPLELGVYEYHPLSMADIGNEAGGWGGRRLVYAMVRDTDVPTTQGVLELP